MHQTQHSSQRTERKWLESIGLLLCIFSFIPYFSSFVVPWIGLPFKTAIILAGGLLIFSEICFYLSLVLLGKGLIKYGKQQIKRIFVLNKYFTKRSIRKLRYCIGIAIALISLAFFILFARAHF